MRLEVKCNFTYAYYTEVIITSNKRIDQWYPGRDIAALERRVTENVYFDRLDISDA